MGKRRGKKESIFGAGSGAGAGAGAGAELFSPKDINAVRHNVLLNERFRDFFCCRYYMDDPKKEDAKKVEDSFEEDIKLINDIIKYDLNIDELKKKFSKLLSFLSRNAVKDTNFAHFLSDYTNIENNIVGIVELVNLGAINLNETYSLENILRLAKENNIFKITLPLKVVLDVDGLKKFEGDNIADVIRIFDSETKKNIKSLQNSFAFEDLFTSSAVDDSARVKNMLEKYFKVDWKYHGIRQESIEGNNKFSVTDITKLSMESLLLFARYLRFRILKPELRNLKTGFIAACTFDSTFINKNFALIQTQNNKNKLFYPAIPRYLIDKLLKYGLPRFDLESREKILSILSNSIYNFMVKPLKIKEELVDIPPSESFATGFDEYRMLFHELEETDNYRVFSVDVRNKRSIERLSHELYPVSQICKEDTRIIFDTDLHNSLYFYINSNGKRRLISLWQIYENIVFNYSVKVTLGEGEVSYEKIVEEFFISKKFTESSKKIITENLLSSSTREAIENAISENRSIGVETMYRFQNIISSQSFKLFVQDRLGSVVEIDESGSEISFEADADISVYSDFLKSFEEYGLKFVESPDEDPADKIIFDLIITDIILLDQFGMDKITEMIQKFIAEKDQTSVSQEESKEIILKEEEYIRDEFEVSEPSPEPSPEPVMLPIFADIEDDPRDTLQKLNNDMENFIFKSSYVRPQDRFPWALGYTPPGCNPSYLLPEQLMKFFAKFYGRTSETLLVHGGMNYGIFPKDLDLEILMPTDEFEKKTPLQIERWLKEELGELGSLLEPKYNLGGEGEAYPILSFKLGNYIDISVNSHFKHKESCNWTCEPDAITFNVNTGYYGYKESYSHQAFPPYNAKDYFMRVIYAHLPNTLNEGLKVAASYSLNNILAQIGASTDNLKRFINDFRESHQIVEGSLESAAFDRSMVGLLTFYNGLPCYESSRGIAIQNVLKARDIAPLIDEMQNRVCPRAIVSAPESSSVLPSQGAEVEL